MFPGDSEVVNRVVSPPIHYGNQPLTYNYQLGAFMNYAHYKDHMQVAVFQRGVVHTKDIVCLQEVFSS
jgi:hypothetical protein